MSIHIDEEKIDAKCGILAGTGTQLAADERSNQSEIDEIITIETKKRTYRYRPSSSCIYKRENLSAGVNVYVYNAYYEQHQFPISIADCLPILAAPRFQILKPTKKFAMKLIEYKKDKIKPDEIEQEMEMLKSLNSDCVISFHDYYQKDTDTHTQYYLFTELLSKGNLVEFSNRGEVTMKFLPPWPLRKLPLEIRILPELEIRIILIQIAEGLSVLHKKGIIHRDIKPQNIFMDYNEKHTIFGVIARVGDLGCAIPFHKGIDSTKHLSSKKTDFAKHPAEHQPPITDEKELLDNGLGPISAKFRTEAGTRGYIAPEVENNKKYGRKADIWSLGVLVHEMYYGKKPEKVKNFVRPSNDPAIELNDLLEKMLVVDPVKRIGISDVLTSPFLRPGYWQFRLWRMELNYIITLGLSVNETIEKVKRYGMEASFDLLVSTVQKLSIWAMGDGNDLIDRHCHNLRDIAYKCSKEFPFDLMNMMTGTTEFPVLVQQQRISTELSTIIGWIHGRLEKDCLYHYRTMSPIQEKLFNLLLTAKSALFGNNEWKNGNEKCLHSILLGKILELCYCEECLELLTTAGPKSGDAVVALEWDNKFDKEELAEKKEQFWDKLLKKLNSSETISAEVHVFFETVQQIPMFLREQQFTFSYEEFFDVSMITTRVEKGTNFYLEISMLATGHCNPENYVNVDELVNIGITYLRFRKCEEVKN